ncbi:MAG: TIGR03557 family F420-dependent LLM class oxidoreductase [Actinomycetota bacterium]|nr:TIGR03557 family F420-dependent LLM class oxidoreductase [Actinomycetota bacterium]
MTRYYIELAHEQFPPSALLRQAKLAEDAGFDGISCSDHFQPWWTPGHAGQAWAWLGAAGQLTERVAIGPGVTPLVHRYHPALVAQFAATLEELFPGRAFLGVGSGESLNETPLGMDWPEPAEQLARLEEGLRLIDRLLDGAEVTSDGYFRTKRAILHTRPARRPPVYVSAFKPEAARLAGRLGDGLWTMGDPKIAKPAVEAYRQGANEAGRPPGEILLHAPFSWAPDDDAALEGARVWKPTLVQEFFTDDWHDPKAMYEHAENEVSDRQFKAKAIIGSDPDDHVKKIKAIEKLGATIVVLMNISGAAPEDAIRVYGGQVLPQLR